MVLGRSWFPDRCKTSESAGIVLHYVFPLHTPVGRPEHDGDRHTQTINKTLSVLLRAPEFLLVSRQLLWIVILARPH